MVSYATENSSAVNSFTDQDKFEGIKRLSDHRASCCGKHQFPANFMVNIVFELSLLNKVVRTKKALSLLHTFAFSCLSQDFWETIGILLIIKHLKRKSGFLKKLFSLFMV